jgi:hypothetical protein
MAITAQRVTALVGMWMVAEGSAFALDPRGQVRLWSSSRAPHANRRAMRIFEARPGLCRALAVAELAAGAGVLWLGKRRRRASLG